ncbi:MAG TPA: excinuclease ABC subunit UvrC [Streptosporangiaceae bacterium]|nr:excinuclease ABC subunit UvrC [Streptosporangiaceae bacterium]
MADPASYRPAPGSIPESPGVYRFRDARGRVIYVGKAKSLRSRLNSYFADFAGLHPRTQMMVTDAASVDWTVVGTEVEALQLEYSWIKEFDPRWNIRYRDDKSYPYLAVTLNEEYPRVTVMRGAKRRGVRYFGPYSHAWAIRDTVDTLLRVFPVRTCSAGVFKRAGQIGRPCLLGYIGKCSAPCVGRISADEHMRLAEEFCDFMAGQTGRFTKRIEAQMREAARAEEFELAARLRDDLQALQRALEKQAVVLPDGTDCDVIGLTEDQLEAAVQVFYIRGGRVRGQRGWVVDKVEDVSTGELVEQFLGQVYRDDPVSQLPISSQRRPDLDDPDLDDPDQGRPDQGRPDQGRPDQGRPERGEVSQDGASQYGAGREGGARQEDGAGREDGTRREGGAGREDETAWPNRRGESDQLDNLVSDPDRHAVPREVLVPELPPNVAALSEWLSVRRGANVTIRVPQRGDKRALLDTVTRNAAEALALHKTRRASDLTTRSQAMHEIQDALGLEEAPLRIECYDVSNLQGTHVVASMVVFEDGLARKSEYRKFQIKGAQTDDLASIREVITRRFRRYLAERDEAPPEDDGSGRRKFAYPPSLVVIDGGAGQVDAAVRALSDLGITDVAVCGLAKRLEEVWLPGEDSPVILPRSSEGLYLLQRVRDEAHRFAITYHRAKRGAAQTVSELDNLPGLGPVRRAALLKHFGSVRKLRAATADQIAEVDGFGPRLAEAVLLALNGGSTDGSLRRRS